LVIVETDGLEWRACLTHRVLLGLALFLHLFPVDLEMALHWLAMTNKKKTFFFFY
jgi:hypothetical protein